MNESFNISKYFENVSRVIFGLGKEKKKINSIVKSLINCQKRGNKILVAGNGGSSADAEHFVGELVCTFIKKDKKPISAINLNSDTASITAWSNDFNFDSFCERMVDAHGKKNDLLFLISTGGGDFASKTSLNLVRAALLAKKKGLKIISLSGKTGGELKKISDQVIVIKSTSTSIIQEAHMSILHSICYLLEEKI
jgi:D-sedoheptulose 7-phosphate isomerase